MGEIISALSSGKQGQTGRDDLPELLHGTPTRRAEQRLEFGEPQFDRIQIRTVGWQVPELRTRRFDPLADALDVYVVAMGNNAVLSRAAEPAMVEARARHAISGQTAHVYTEPSYQAQTWAHPGRVIIKAEVVQHPGREPRDNPRFVVTNLRQSPQWLYETVYAPHTCRFACRRPRPSRRAESAAQHG